MTTITNKSVIYRQFLGRPRYHVGYLSGLENPRQTLHGSHRLASVSSALFDYGPVAGVLQPDSHHQAVCGQSDRLHSHEGHSGGCAEHVLLDPFHLLGEERVQEEGRYGSGVSRRRYQQGSQGYEGLQVLPVGVFLFIFSSEYYLQMSKCCMFIPCRLCVYVLSNRSRKIPRDSYRVIIFNFQFIQ